MYLKKMCMTQKNRGLFVGKLYETFKSSDMAPTITSGNSIQHTVSSIYFKFCTSLLTMCLPCEPSQSHVISSDVKLHHSSSISLHRDYIHW